MRKTKHGPPKGRKHADVKRSAFGERLYRTRKARGISQQELGDIVGLSKRMISYYEGDAEGPPMKTLIDLAKALDVTTSYLMGESPLKLVKDDTSADLKKHLETLQRLSPKDRRAILRMTDALASQKHD